MQDEKYCVYLHKKKIDGEVFYVGSGTKARAKSRRKRNNEWQSIVDSLEYEVVIIKEGLTLLEARNIEQETIASGEYKNLVNKNKVVTQQDFSQEEIENLKLYINYDITSPTNLRYTSITNSKRVKPHTPAGSLAFDSNGKKRHCRISVLCKTTSVARVVWMLFHGAIPYGYYIDHIDGDVHNNAIENLRMVTACINSRNNKNREKTTNYFNNIKLPAGFHLIQKNRSPKALLVSVCLLGENFSKHFSLNMYSFEEAFEAAKAWRVNKLAELNVLSDYTERHLGFSSEKYIGVKVTRKSKGRAGVSGIKVIQKNGVVVTVTAGIGDYKRKTFTVGKNRSYDEAIELAKLHIENIKIKQSL